MKTLLIAFGVFLVAVIGMSLGVIFSNKRIKGSCGGLNNFQDSEGNAACDMCTNPSPTCAGERAQQPEAIGDPRA